MASIAQNKGNNAMADDREDRDEADEKLPARQSPGGPPSGKSDAGEGGGFFHLYKSGHGYWTRMLTAGGAAILIALTANFLYRIAMVGVEPKIKIPIVAVFCVGSSILAWWLMNKPRNAEFLIATDSEMKKVNWTSQKELWGSTKVVIFFMFMMAIMLFVTDVVFAQFFKMIGVLQQGYF